MSNLLLGIISIINLASKQRNDPIIFWDLLEALPKLLSGSIISLATKQSKDLIKPWGPLKALPRLLLGRIINLASNRLYDPIKLWVGRRLCPNYYWAAAELIAICFKSGLRLHIT